MSDDQQPTFEESAFVAAIQAATAFLQERMCLQHWRFKRPILGKRMDDSDMFNFVYTRHYLTGGVEYARLDSTSWGPVSDEYLARGLVHELTHAILAPVATEISDNLRGCFLERVVNAEETVADHITTIIWNSLTQADKDYLMGLFQKARAVNQPVIVDMRRG